MLLKLLIEDALGKCLKIPQQRHSHQGWIWDRKLELEGVQILEL